MLGWLPTLPGAKPNLAAKSSSCSFIFLPSSMSVLSFSTIFPPPPPAFLLFPECPKLAPTSGPSHMLFPIIFCFLLQVLIQRLLLPFLSLHFLFYFLCSSSHYWRLSLFTAHLLLKHQLVVGRGSRGHRWKLGTVSFAAEFLSPNIVAAT